jgi:catechol 1,2-dioxygenase
MITMDGHRPLISQIFDSATEYLDNDSVFAVKEDLIGELKKSPEGSKTDYVMDFNFVLKREAMAMAAE